MGQTAIPPIFYILPDDPKIQILFPSVPKGNLRPVCRNKCKHNIYHELKLTIMDLDLQITWKHPVVGGLVVVLSFLFIVSYVCILWVTILRCCLDMEVKSYK